MNAILEDKSILKDRLEKLQIAISKATDDSWKQSTTNTTNSSPRSTVNSSNASFLLGMDLFGQDVSVLERGIQDKLEDVEDELKKLLVAAAEQPQPDESMRLDASTTNDDEDEDDEDDEQALAERATAYKQHIAFLKKASLARTALDEATTLSSPALTTTEVDLLQASKELMMASDYLEKAQKDLAANTTTTTTTNDDERQLERSTQIVTSLRQGIRRHRVELVHKAASVLDTAIQINYNNNNNAGTTSSSSNNNNNNMTTTTTTAAVTSSCSGGSLSAKASTQLEAAYQVLETLEGGHSALEESMRRLTRRLYQEVLEPIVLDLNHNNNTQNYTSNIARPWKVVEAADKPSKGLVGVSTVTSKGTVHRLEWERDDEDMTTTNDYNPIAAWKNTLQLLDRILAFVQSKILLERPKLCHLVGTKLFGRPHALPSALKLEALGLESSRLGDDRGILMETLVELLIKTSLPSDAPLESATSLRQTRQGLMDICIPFCRSLASKHLLVEPDSRPKLVAVCQDLEKLYVDHRRCILLNQARDILLTKTDYHNTVRVGVEIDDVATTNTGNSDDAAIKGVFQLHRSSISETASQLMTLVRATMDESVDAVKFAKPNENDTTPTALALLRPTLYRTARDMLHLFRAMIPASQGAEIRQVPRTAAVLHNDCLFLAHHCLTLGLEYKERFDDNNGDEAAYGTTNNEEEIRGKLLRQTCLFVDMVPLFRELADQCMGDMLETQKLQVAELVGSRISYFGKSLASNESLHEWSEAETALAAGIYHLRHLSQAWKSVLSVAVYGRSMGYLADVLLALYLQQVLSSATTVIAPTASAFVCGLFRKALDDLRPIITIVQQQQSQQQQQQQKPNSVALEWDRFMAIKQCLELPTLSDIQVALSRGVFRSVVGQELAKLIRAKYPQEMHAQQRNHLLNQLATTVVGE